MVGGIHYFWCLNNFPKWKVMLIITTSHTESKNSHTRVRK